MDLARLGRLPDKIMINTHPQQWILGDGRWGYRLSVISYRLSVISYQLSVIGYRLSVIGYLLSVIGYRLSGSG
jgi:hypothetical protein